ncbi:MAG TPA: GGDEF domain-containing protein [Synergistaceae bacterium]|nr:GGDEF domain-containing protein [Synergistaceae bacterium]
MASAHLLRKKEAERLHRIATTDALTGLPNRRSFFDTLNREIARCHRHGKPLSLILCDIDFFKEVNDTYGHDTGDYVLRQFGRNLRRALRAEDFLSRYGGEEFGMILPETDLPRAIQVAERLRYETEKALFSAERGKKDAPRIQLTASFGVAQLELHKDTREALFSRADLLLYQAKNAGRNSVYPSPESLVSDSGTSSEDKTSS